jgi:molybdopterin synthase catalytic subunit
MKIISIAGYKKTGKTTLVERLIKSLTDHGSVGTIKHMHDTNLNTPNSDTWKHVQAGAEITIGVTQNELVKFSHKNALESALDELANSGMDFCIVEGFKNSSLPKIALGDWEVSNIMMRFEKPECANLEEIIKVFMKLPEYHTLDSLIHKIKHSKDIGRVGAIGTFTGIVRAVSGDIRTEFLEFEEYDGVVQGKMNEICSELKEKEGIIEVAMHHRMGIIQQGEDIVYIVVAAGHREQLFPVLSEAINRLKTEVPIWKKEHTLKGEWWVNDIHRED